MDQHHAAHATAQRSLDELADEAPRTAAPVTGDDDDQSGHAPQRAYKRRIDCSPKSASPLWSDSRMR